MNTIRTRTAVAAVALVAELALTACQHEPRPSGAAPAAGPASGDASTAAGSRAAASAAVAER
ncbi:hypothetical protein AB0M39_06830 [Streptomyces sp. NPDC051907]|uniref:hypothetical protein n=1 Tax=Streptomyces sp. NPDC051907 TaxID=3155284 RepID=UPI0034491FAB